MQCIKQGLQRFISNNLLSAKHLNCLPAMQRTFYEQSHMRNMDQESHKKSKFTAYNKIIFPPTKPGEKIRPGYVCHMRRNIKYSPLNMWYIAMFVRGMTVDEAVKQLSFLVKKGAAIAKEVILEAQRKAVEEHNIEFKSNLWIAESFATKGMVVKGIRRHARGRVGMVHYRYCNYFVRLEEGNPPKNYYLSEPKSGEQLLEDWMNQMRNRKIMKSL